MYKKILVAIDESERAFRALQEAFSLASCLSSELVVLYVNKANVYEVLNEPLDIGKIEEKIKNEMVIHAEELWYKANILLPDLAKKAKFVKRENKNIAKAIVDVAQEEEVDLIVLGGRILPGASSIILRSVTNTVLGIVDKPVLVVR